MIAADMVMFWPAAYLDLIYPSIRYLVSQSQAFEELSAICGQDISMSWATDSPVNSIVSSDYVTNHVMTEHPVKTRGDASGYFASFRDYRRLLAFSLLFPSFFFSIEGCGCYLFLMHPSRLHRCV